MTALFNIAAFAFILAVLSAIYGTVTSRVNEPAPQSSRWVFFLSTATLASAMAGLVVGILFSGFGNLWRILSALVSCLAFAGTVAFSGDVFLIDILGNSAAAATDKFFSRGDSVTGIRIYRIFFGGLRAKFPWEKVATVFDLEKDTLINWSYQQEFQDAPGPINGTAALRPRKDGLQQYLATSTDSTKRDNVLRTVFKDIVTQVLSDFIMTHGLSEGGPSFTIEEAMAHKGEIVAEIKALAEADDGNPLAEFQRTYGVRLNSFVIADINYPEDVRNVNEELAVQDNLAKLANKILDGWGVNPDSASGDERKSAFEQALVVSGKVGRQIVDMRGGRGLVMIPPKGGVQ